MKKVAISIPVHQSPDCIENMVQNFQKYVPNSKIVLHVSADNPPLLNQINEFQKRYDGFLFINPTRYHTFKADEAAQVTGLSTVHASNIQYISQIDNFDIMAFNTSNDMFVRAGIQDDFNSYLCGCSSKLRHNPDTFPYTELVQILKKVINIQACEKTTQEGFWCPMEAGLFFAKKVFEIMELCQITSLPAEEGFLPNLVLNQFPDLYDSMADQYVYHDPSEGAAVATEKIYQIQRGEIPFKYAVKRVPRSMSDPTRKLINSMV